MMLWKLKINRMGFTSHGYARIYGGSGIAWSWSSDVDRINAFSYAFGQMGAVLLNIVFLPRENAKTLLHPSAAQPRHVCISRLVSRFTDALAVPNVVQIVREPPRNTTEQKSLMQNKQQHNSTQRQQDHHHQQRAGLTTSKLCSA